MYLCLQSGNLLPVYLKEANHSNDHCKVKTANQLFDFVGNIFDGFKELFIWCFEELFIDVYYYGAKPMYIIRSLYYRRSPIPAYIVTYGAEKPKKKGCFITTLQVSFLLLKKQSHYKFAFPAVISCLGQLG